MPDISIYMHPRGLILAPFHTPNRKKLSFPLVVTPVTFLFKFKDCWVSLITMCTEAQILGRNPD
jgi:hypothetical protein